ncbi:hypothetical protein FRC03_011659 [Tulasnella sp. 419]|nr:hypothetical protein FRC03_011659 [Tulasnella sp. 419]
MSPITQELQQQTQQQQQQQPPPPPPAHQLYPALHLYPVNNSFLPKQIALPPGDEHVIIGRQSDSMTVPGERNGYFDSKALDRRHAEVWEEDGKIFIRDVKSSNGTYINGERLSPEGVESDPFELRTDDILEFGIDIFEEDSQTIIHHKVAAKVHCVLGPEDLPLHALQNTTQDGLEQNSALGNAPGDPIKYPDSSSVPQNDSTQNPNAGRRPSMTSLAQSNPPDFRGVDASVSALQGDE